MWEVSEVTSAQLPTGFRSGFNVTTDRGRRPIVLFVYETQEEAEAAEAKLQRLSGGPSRSAFRPCDVTGAGISEPGASQFDGISRRSA